MLAATLLMTACVTLTPEQKAALDTYTRENVRKAVISQKYDINVTTMTPMRATGIPVTGYWLKVDSIYLDVNLPYAGRDDIPHLKTRQEARMDSRLEFRGEILEYVLRLQPKEQRAIATFTTDYRGNIYKFTVTIEEDTDVQIHMEPEERDYIDYDGTIYIPKPDIKQLKDTVN